MSEEAEQRLLGAIVDCMLYERPGLDRVRVMELVKEDVLGKPGWRPSAHEVNQLQAKIMGLLGPEGDRIDLVYGGATKIKGYVFEAARLPEIRGASALLDFAGIEEVRRIFGEDHVIYAGGGSFLAFAPAGQGATLAAAFEQNITHLTQTALAVAVARTFRLVELRFGRVNSNAQDRVSWWVEEFQRAYQNKELQQELAAYYYASREDATPGARFYQRKGFGELVTVLATMYNRRRDERAAHGPERHLPFVPRLPWMARCASSDHRPAVLETDNYGDLSAASARKLAVGRVLKNDRLESVWEIERAIGWKVPTSLAAKSWEARWRDFLIDKGARTSYARRWEELGRAVRPAPDTHTIGMAGQGRARGFIGLIYADGNNVGRKLATLATPQQYADFSKRLEDAAQDAVFAALAELLCPAEIRAEDGREPFIHPFEILAIGGDDLLLIVPGQHALEIAARIGQEFEQRMADENEPRKFVGRYRGPVAEFEAYTPTIGLSAGVVIARADAPIFFLRELVEQLLKSAKKLARDQPEAGGAVDFMVLKSITMVTDTLAAFRREALEGSQCRLTARPYLWPELAGLVATLKGLKKAGVPRSQLYRLRAALEPARDQGPLPSSLEYLYTRTRQPDEVAAALQQHVELNWGGAGLTPPWLPRTSEGGKTTRWETIWADVVEIYDMVEASDDDIP